MKEIAVLAVLVASAAAIGTFAIYGSIGATTGTVGTIEFESIRKGTHGCGLNETEVILNSEGEYLEMSERCRIEEDVNMGQESVIVVSMGSRPSGGYSIEVTDITGYEDKVVIDVKRTSPGPGCGVTMAITDPIHIIRTERITRPIEFNYTDEVTRCREDLEDVCLDTGGTVEKALCCENTGDFPNTCKIGACGCAPENSHEVNICDCGEGKCFDPAEGCVPYPE